MTMMKSSPVETAEKLPRHAPEFTQRIENSESRKYSEMKVLRDRLRVTSGRPYGTFVSRISTQDCVLGLEFLHFLKRA
jgi:hypothetical protein